MNTGGPYGCLNNIGTTGGYKEKPKFHWVYKGVGFAHSTACIPETTQLWERKGAIPSSCLRRREGRRLSALGRLVTPYISESSEETIPECQIGDCERLWKKMIGKPYSGKPNVRFEVAGNGEVLLVYLK